MSWTRICAIDDMRPGTAASFRVNDSEVLLVRTPDRTIALASVCTNVARFLIDGDFRECVIDGVPACNRHAAGKKGDGASVPFGLCDEPIYLYGLREIDGGVCIDLEKRTLSPYRHITCSPVIEDGRAAALQFSLWLDGTHVQRATGRPLRRQP